MEFLYLHMPISGVTVFWPGLVILGFGVGIAGGFFGMGGGWMVTPGLNILGFPMAFAIGTDISHMAGKSLMATIAHSRYGNVDYRLGVVMILGTVAGFEVGAQMIMWLERIGQVDFIVRVAYLGLLALIAWVVFWDVAHKRRADREAKLMQKTHPVGSAGIQWHKALHRLRIPPMVTFPRAGIRCSLWVPVLVSFFTGWLAGMLGIGGGLIRMPALVYLVGVPTHVAVGTDLFEVVISGLYGAATYTYKGRTELVAAIVMMLGAAVGAQIGTAATKYVHGYGIRTAFGYSVVGCAVSVAMKLVAGLVPAWSKVLDRAATILILVLVAGLATAILYMFVKGVREERRMRLAVTK